MPERIVYLVTGAIGTGKTTFSRYLLPFLNNVEYIGADFYFYPLFWSAEKEEYKCYEDSKEYTKYKIEHAIEQGRAFVLEKTFFSETDLSLLDFFIQKNYQIVTFFLGVDSLEKLIFRSNKRADDGWYCVPEEKIIRHWNASKEVFDIIRMKSQFFYAIDTSNGYKLVLCEENKELLYLNSDCSWIPSVLHEYHIHQSESIIERSPLLHVLHQLLCNIQNPECQTITNNMTTLGNYSIIDDNDLLEIDRIKNISSRDEG
jgi:predicted ABC-type ATPase